MAMRRTEDDAHIQQVEADNERLREELQLMTSKSTPSLPHSLSHLPPPSSSFAWAGASGDPVCHLSSLAQGCLRGNAPVPKLV